jgi:hypothetical protein
MNETFALIFMSAFVVTGYDDIKTCMEAREIVTRQFGRNLDAGAVCVPLPKDYQVIGHGTPRTTGRK